VGTNMERKGERSVMGGYVILMPMLLDGVSRCVSKEKG
jgi:hypothetical protein